MVIKAVSKGKGRSSYGVLIIKGLICGRYSGQMFYEVPDGSVVKASISGT